MRAALLVLATTAVVRGAAAAGIEGRWTTFDDDTGRPRSVVEIESDHGTYSGRIVTLTLDPGEPAEPRCTACSGARADAPIIGMVVLRIARRSDAEGYSGTAFDPEDGTEYRCTVTLAPAGDALVIRGYVGIPLFGRTVTWRRAP